MRTVSLDELSPHKTVGKCFPVPVLGPWVGYTISLRFSFLISNMRENYCGYQFAVKSK